MKKIAFRYWNAASLAIVICVNALAIILPINGMSTGQISDLYPSLFTPKGFTFSIWGVIYFSLIAFVIGQSVIVKKSFYPFLSKWFIVSCALNCLWILAWHFLLIELSVLLMVALLFALIKIFLLVQKEIFNLSGEILIKLPFVIYLSWICVATIANISAELVHLGWLGSFLTPLQWTNVMIVVASLLSSFMVIRFNVPAFSVVTIWALFGIYSRWEDSEFGSISSNAFFWIVALGFVFVYQVAKMVSRKLLIR